MSDGIADHIVGALLVVDLTTEDIGLIWVNFIPAPTRGLVYELEDYHDELAIRRPNEKMSS